MPYDNLSASLDAATVASILAKIKEIEALVPFRIGLTNQERQTLPKISNQTVFFVEDALAAAENHPDLAPRYLDVAELKADLALWKQMDAFVTSLSTLSGSVEDTALAAGSEAFTAALSFYNSVKRAAKDGVPGAQEIADDLGRRFERARREEPPTA